MSESHLNVDAVLQVLEINRVQENFIMCGFYPQENPDKTTTNYLRKYFEKSYLKVETVWK